MEHMEIKEAVSNIIYNELGYMYCDNCRFDSEQPDEYSCDICNRKYNGWGVSRGVTDALAEEIVEIINQEDVIRSK